MKKLLTIFLALVLTLSLAGCSKYPNQVFMSTHYEDFDEETGKTTTEHPGAVLYFAHMHKMKEATGKFELNYGVEEGYTATNSWVFGVITIQNKQVVGLPQILYTISADEINSRSVTGGLLNKKITGGENFEIDIERDKVFPVKDGRAVAYFIFMEVGADITSGIDFFDDGTLFVDPAAHFRIHELTYEYNGSTLNLGVSDSED